MTDADWFNDLLSAEWGNSDDSLSTDLPQPTTATEGTKERRRRSVQADDPYIFITDGGNPIIEPRSVGYREEYVEAVLSIDVETPHSRQRLVGTADDQYDGLIGEVKRVCHKYRSGMDAGAPVVDPGFDIIRFDTYEDEIGKRGAGRWGGLWTVRFITFVQRIGQEPVRP